MSGDLPLERYHRLQAGAADLRRLPFAAKVDGQTVTREGEDLVVLHEDHSERFRQAEVRKGGLKGLFGGTETGVLWHDGAQTRLLRPNGATEPAEFPGGLPADAALRARTRQAEDLRARATSPLQKAVVDVPFGSLETARAVLQATAPALPGPAGTAVLAVAMAEAFPATAGHTLPVLQAELATSTEPLPQALATALQKPPRDPAATLKATADLLQSGQALGLDLAVRASGLPGGAHLVPALLAATPGVDANTWAGRYLGQAPKDLAKIPTTAAGYALATASLDAAGRRAMLTAARGLGAEGDLLADLASTADVATVAKVLGAGTPGAAAEAALQGDPKNVGRLLTYVARGGDPAIGTLQAIGGVRTSSQYESARSAQTAALPGLLQGDARGALQAGLGALTSRVAVADLSRLLLPELPDANARVLEDLLDQPFGGQYESLRTTVTAGVEGLGDAPVDFALRLLGTTSYATSQKAIVRAVAARAPQPLPLELRLAERMAGHEFGGQYESFGTTAQALLKPPQGTSLLQAALGTTTYSSSQKALVSHWLDLGQAPPAAEAFLRAVIALPFSGQYESLNSTLAALAPDLQRSALELARAALGTTTYSGTTRGLAHALEAAAQTPTERRLGGFLKSVTDLTFSGQYESMSGTVGAALNALRPGDAPGQAVLRAGLAAVGSTTYKGTQVGIARAAAAAAAPDRTVADVSSLFRTAVPDAEIEADPAGALQRLLDGWSETPAVQADAPAGEIRQEPETVTIGGIVLPVARQG